MKSFLTSILIATVGFANGQHVPPGLLEKKVQSELISKTGEFDSLILLDKASYWDDDMKIAGLAFKRNQIYELIISFQADTSSFYDMKIKLFKTAIISDQSVIESIKKINFSLVIALNAGSLNYRKVIVSDLPAWTIILLKNKQLTIRQSNAPDVYQSANPTKDRALFIDLFHQLTALNN